MDVAALRRSDLESRRICRFCLRANERLQIVTGDCSLSTRITSSLSLEVTPNDGLPPTVCDQCLRLAEQFYLFKDQCARAEMVLRTFAQTGIPLMQFFQPMEFECFQVKKEFSKQVHVGVQYEPAAAVEVSVQTASETHEIGIQVEEGAEQRPTEVVAEKEAFHPANVKIEQDDDDVILVESIKQEVDDGEGWDLADEELGELANELYGEESADVARPTTFEGVETILNNQVNSDGSMEIQVDQLKTLFAKGNVLADDQTNNLSHFSHTEYGEAVEDLETDIDIESTVLMPVDSCSTLDLVYEQQSVEECVDLTSQTLTEESDVEEIVTRTGTDRIETAECKSPTFSEAMLPLMDDATSKEIQITSEQSDSSNSNTLQTTLDIVYEGIPTTPMRESDGLSSKFANQELGEILSDDELDPISNLNGNMEQIKLTETNQPSPQQQPVPATPEELFQCQKCDKFFPQYYQLDIHEKAYHGSPGKAQVSARAGSSTPARKMTIVIDNPCRQCPKCGAMVLKASFGAHIRSHRSGDKTLINSDKETTTSSM